MEDELLDNDLAGTSRDANADSPATFSKKLFLKFGICHTNTGTDAIISNNNITDHIINFPSSTGHHPISLASQMLSILYVCNTLCSYVRSYLIKKTKFTCGHTLKSLHNYIQQDYSI